MRLGSRNQKSAAQEQGADLVFASYLGTKFLTLTYEPKNGLDLVLSFFLPALALPQWPSKAQIDVVSKMEQIQVASFLLPKRL